LLRAADVVFGYRGGDAVLRGASMEVPAGGFVGILGPNGSGKTTMLKVLAGTMPPSRGRVTLEGVELARIPRAALARRMAVVPQETHLAFDYSVLEVVLMGRYPHLGAFQVEGPADVAIAREALAATGTFEFQDRPFRTLSGGEKQRVIIAAALAQISATGAKSPGLQESPGLYESPGLHDSTRRAGFSAPPESILLLDEPTAALDLAYQLELANLLRDLQRRRPMAIVVSTHDLNFAASLCRTLVLLRNGEVIAAGPADDVLTPARIRALYGVEADVHRHAPSGRLVVVPLARTPPGPGA
jgi:iron complex transport system ATP-binding protein